MCTVYTYVYSFHVYIVDSKSDKMQYLTTYLHKLSYKSILFTSRMKIRLASSNEKIKSQEVLTNQPTIIVLYDYLYELLNLPTSNIHRINILLFNITVVLKIFLVRNGIA